MLKFNRNAHLPIWVIWSHPRGSYLLYKYFKSFLDNQKVVHLYPRKAKEWPISFSYKGRLKLLEQNNKVIFVQFNIKVHAQLLGSLSMQLCQCHCLIIGCEVNVGKLGFHLSVLKAMFMVQIMIFTARPYFYMAPCRLAYHLPPSCKIVCLCPE